MSKRVLDDETILRIKKLANFPQYTKAKLARMYYVDESTIRAYLKTDIRRAS